MTVARDGQPIEHTFTVVNPGFRPVSILSKSCTCTCTEAALSQQALGPGESCTLTMKARIPYGYARLDLSCLLTTDEPTHPEWPYHLKIESFPRAQIVPQVIDLGTIAPDHGSRRNPRLFRDVAHLEVYAIDDEPDAPIGIPEVPGELIASVSKTPRKGRVGDRIRKRSYPIDLEVVSTPSVEGVHSGTVTISVGPGTPATASAVWRTQGVMTVTPSNVSFGLVDPRRPTPKRQVRIRSSDGKPFRVLAVIPEDPCVSVSKEPVQRFPTSPAAEHVVALALDGRVDPSKAVHSGIIKIRTDLDGAEESKIPWSLILRPERPQGR